MGRRLLLNLGFVVSAALVFAPATVRAQAPAIEPPTAEPAVDKTAKPLELPPESAATTPSAPPAGPAVEPIPAPAKALKLAPPDEAGDSAPKKPVAKDNSLVMPASVSDPGGMRTFTPASDALGDPAPRDNSVTRTQAATPKTAPTAATPATPATAAAPEDSLPAPGSKQPDVLASERIPLGKQSLAVTVDVQSPATMNLNQPATLKLIVKNIGSDDALNVVVTDLLPDGVEFVSSQTNLTRHPSNASLLVFQIPTLTHGTERVITFKVKPTKQGSFDHAATVTFLTGSKSRTLVHAPQLKVDQKVSTPKVLKGQQVEFKVSVTNIGDGPARNVAIQAKLSPGLRPGSVKAGDEHMMYELMLPVLDSGQSEELDPLVADALLGGDQSCTVTATSPDVIPHNKDTAENVKTVTVVEPKLELVLAAPAQRVTDSIGSYKVTLQNPGTAPARKVGVVVTLPISGRLMNKPADAVYDPATRRLKWTLDQVDVGAPPQTFKFDLKMGGVGDYQVTAEARAEGGLLKKDRKNTDVVGIADVDLVVSEQKRVVDVGGKTVFRIKLSNYGTKEATNVKVSGIISKNLSILSTAGLDADKSASRSADGLKIEFPVIEKLAAGKARVLAIEVKVIGDDPKLGTCKVSVEHDGLSEKFEDMAFIKIMSSGREESVTAVP
jgi:uncharacterized repeat protein (TIGR01451 family)